LFTYAYVPGSINCTGQTAVTEDDDRRQRAKQYWPIRRASNK